MPEPARGPGRRPTSPVVVVPAGSADSRLADIERNVRVLIRDLATARADLADCQTGHERQTERLLLRLVEVLDAFERVFTDLAARDQVSAKAKGWMGNFRAVYRSLSTVIAEQGVTPIETPTRQFDPAWHRVVELVSDPELPAGTIVREEDRGYARGQHVLRKTGVVVVGASPQAADGKTQGTWAGS